MRSHLLLLPLDLLVLLFGVTALFASAPTYNPDLSYPIQQGILVAMAVYFAIAHGLFNWGMAYWLGRLMMLAGIAYAVFFILQYAHQNYGDTPAIIEQFGAMTTLLPDLGYFLGHVNAAATFLEAMIPLGTVLILTTRQLIFRLWWVAGTLVCLYALVLTFSRGALLGLAVAVCVAIVILGKRWYVRLIGLLLIAGGVAAAALIDVSSSWILTRWTIYQNSLYVLTDYLFTGIGLGDTFPLIYSRYGLLIQVPLFTYPHNFILSMWAGQGLAGLLIFAALVIVMLFFITRVLRGARPRRLFHAGWLGLLVILTHSLFDSRQYVEALWLMTHLFALLGLTVATGRLALNDKLKVVEKARVRYFPLRLAAVSLIALIVAAVVWQDPLRAAWHTNLGALDETRAALADGLNDDQRALLNESAQAAYQTALEFFPEWPNANRRSGNLYVTTENFTAAIAPLETAYAHEPRNPAAIKGLGLAYVWVGRTEEAAAMFNQLPEPDTMADELLVWGFWRGGHNALLSAYAYETSVLMRPDDDNVMIWQFIADGYNAAHDVDNARIWYERILAVDLDHEAARNGLAQINAQS